MSTIYEVARVSVDSESITKNGLIWPFIRNENSSFLRDGYLALGITYPKFYKMDTLSKLCFFSVEILVNEFNKKIYLNDRCAIVLANAASSSETDKQYLQGLNETGTGSPLQFVYTLPNVMVGELCIRHSLYVHTEMYVMPILDEAFLSQQSSMLIEAGICEHALIGWVDVMNGNLRAECMLVTKHQPEPK